MEQDPRWLPGPDAAPARPHWAVPREHSRHAGNACALSWTRRGGDAYALPHPRRRRRGRAHQHRHPRGAQARRAVVDCGRAEHRFALRPEALESRLARKIRNHRGEGMTRSAWTSAILYGALLATIWSGAAIGAPLGADPACDSHQAAVTGGPLPPPDSHTRAIRWLANAHYELP